MHSEISDAMAYAIVNDDALQMEELIKQGESLENRDRQKNTILHIAASNDAKSCVRILLDLGCEVDARNAWGNTPLGMALFSFKGDGSVITQLLEHGADPDCLNNFGNSPRMAAELIADVDVAKYFGDAT